MNSDKAAKTNQTDEIREYFRGMHRSTAAQAARALGIDADVCRARCSDMSKRGWLIHLPGTKGLYEFKEIAASESGRDAVLRTKLWRAIRIAKSFTIWDAAMYSGATLDYAKKYTASLLRQGLVAKTGKDGQKAIYRCLAEERTATPRLIRKRPVPGAADHQVLVDLGWALMRAIRDGNREATIDLHWQVGVALEGEKVKSEK